MSTNINWKKIYQEWLNLARRYREEARKCRQEACKPNRKTVCKMPAKTIKKTNNKGCKNACDLQDQEQDQEWRDICNSLGINFSEDKWE